MTTLAWTGMRVSEALGLRWEDVDFDNREIRVRFQLDPNGNSGAPRRRPGSGQSPSYRQSNRSSTTGKSSSDTDSRELTV